MRSAVLVHPGSEHATLYRRLEIATDVSVWASLLGELRDVTSLAAVLLLERGPIRPSRWIIDEYDVSPPRPVQRKLA